MNDLLCRNVSKVVYRWLHYNYLKEAEIPHVGGENFTKILLTYIYINGFKKTWVHMCTFSKLFSSQSLWGKVAVVLKLFRNITINHITPNTRVFWLHFWCRLYWSNFSYFDVMDSEMYRVV